MPQQKRTPHYTLVVACSLIVLAFGWGIYESVMLYTGVIPKY